jgi:hypothetical protein
MKTLIQLIGLLFISQNIATAQSKIFGKITDKKGESLAFANIMIEGSYDGATANDQGLFSFSSNANGNKTLIISMIGYETLRKTIVLMNTDLQLNLSLSESINSLNAVVVTAGMFEASDEKKMVMLKPMDIVTTAGGNADITTVMQLLPGATRVGEAEGLFVRGGAANETKTVIDGMIVQNPFFSSTPDVPQRGRFNPFQFKGTSFSTGGYSAQYGQALSSVLLLNTQDKISSNSNTSYSLNMAGIGLSHTHKGWLTGAIQYTNIAPLLAVAKSNIDFEKIPQGLGASLTVNEILPNKASIKAYASYTKDQSAINLPDYSQANTKYLFQNNNNNIFSHASYKQSLANGLWNINGGVSYSRNKDNLSLYQLQANRYDQRSQARIIASRLYGKSNSSTLSFGTEAHSIQNSNVYNGRYFALDELYMASFVEAEQYLSPAFALRAGLRAEYSQLLHKNNLAPRLSLAYKLNQYAQVSLAAGSFYQNPEKEYLYQNKKLDFEKAKHIIANYQIIKNKRTFRTEVFYKKYSSLIKEHNVTFDPNPYRFPVGKFSNQGHGHAQGFDLFFRDQKTIKSGEYWLTYSYLDTEREFKNYPKSIQPAFASKHNLSVVYKQFISKISTNLGVTFSHTAGRPIYRPADTFNSIEYSKAFQNLSLMASKIRQKNGRFTVFYLIADNLANRKNIFAYRYTADGSSRTAVTAPINRMFFAGTSITIGRLNGRSKEADLDF